MGPTLGARCYGRVTAPLVESCVLPQRRLELRPFFVDVDVDVGAKLPRLAQPVAQAGVALVQPFERLPDRPSINVEMSRQPWKERRQRRRNMDTHRAQSTTTASTDVMPGRYVAISDHEPPSSALANSCPVLVPK